MTVLLYVVGYLTPFTLHYSQWEDLRVGTLFFKNLTKEKNTQNAGQLSLSKSNVREDLTTQMLGNG